MQIQLVWENERGKKGILNKWEQMKDVIEQARAYLSLHRES